MYLLIFWSVLAETFFSVETKVELSDTLFETMYSTINIIIITRYWALAGGQNVGQLRSFIVNQVLVFRHSLDLDVGLNGG